MGISAISLFSGAGGLDLAAKWSGIRTVCYVENDRYAQGVLMSRIRDGSLDDAPIWDDVTTFDGKPWRGKVDCVFGGFPCQDVSVSGPQSGIIEGNRSGLWKEFARIVCEVGPRFVLVENVPGLLLYGQLGIVLGDLASLGFDAEWEVLSAAEVGAPHLRERVWIVANSYGWNVETSWTEGNANRSSGEYGASGSRQRQSSLGREWWAIEPNVGRVAHGVAFRVDRLRCCGNGVVPQQALPAFQKIIELAGEMK